LTKRAETALRNPFVLLQSAPPLGTDVVPTARLGT